MFLKLKPSFYLLFLPLALWMLLFLVLPYTRVFIQSFYTIDDFGVLQPALSFDSYKRFFTKELYYFTLFKTFGLSAVVTAIALIVSIPLAYYIAFKATKNKTLLYTLIILPLWVSYIVRAYAWKIILGEEGILNSFLQFIGFIDSPISALLYSDLAVVIGMVHIYTPFVLMPIYTSFEQIPTSLVEASKDLGANRFITFFKVVLPLSLPGIITGGTFAFVLSLGDFLAPNLLGGSNTLFISNIFQNMFGTSNDKPLGSAIGIVLLVVVLFVLDMSSRAEKRYSSLNSDRT
ncbi:MAG: ABC transporter permease [Cytophagia bacterium]|nr:MAG: ABC transporter permease [Runella slithyformis]TAG18790.1 MAG: ABC transporter permease [Cytophagales bacterium]TAG40390.1 MAG: ABC transporter permease [Cytophagia bacterium]TAG79706.1 MAG: ABC transporter permease [Cytophagales bacterium]